jgi:hypothetical protein
MTRDPRPYWITAGIVAAAALILLAMGRVPICKCGYVKLWHGVVMSGENSQHLADWYTPSHLLHGLIFYWALWLVLPKLAFGWRLALATLVEAGWEVLENSSLVIERYRTVTMSLDYYGDSVVNSTADILVMVVGFFMARFVPVWVSLATIVGFEVLTAIEIRDGLFLNVVMLLWPIDAILDWQSGLTQGG